MSPIDRFNNYREWALGVAFNVVRIRPLPPSISLEDCKQVALLALWDVAHRYREDSPASFATFASHRINGAVLDLIRTERWFRRKADVTLPPLSLQLVTESLEGDFDDPLEVRLEDRAFPVDEIVCLRDAIDRLPDQLRFVFDRCDLGGELLREVAVDLGVSESRVSQLRGRAYDELRRALA